VRRLQDLSVESKTLIQQHSINVVRDGMTIMIHGHSECVLHVLKAARDRGIRIQVISTKCQHNKDEGLLVKDFCDEHQIPCKLVSDAAMALCMDKIDCVFVGAEAVLENGGIVNKVGTFTLALCAKQFNKPFYVFAESLKFMKRFPLQ
jgi:translation initiation factor eIF-2B subunit alpha